jgi:cold shock CspA family protein
LRKAPPTKKVRTSFNIVAGVATELSGCDFSAEVEMRQAEGEGEIERNGYRNLENVECRPRLRFIKDDSGCPDMFLHISALQSAGIDPDNLRLGEPLTFDVESSRYGAAASGRLAPVANVARLCPSVTLFRCGAARPTLKRFHGLCAAT